MDYEERIGREAFLALRRGVMNADEAFQKSGEAGTKTWLRDFLFPELEKEGVLVVLESQKAALQTALRELEAGNNGSYACLRFLEAARRFATALIPDERKERWLITPPKESSVAMAASIADTAREKLVISAARDAGPGAPTVTMTISTGTPPQISASLKFTTERN